MADQQVIFRYYEEPIQYNVIENNMSRGKPLLVSSYRFLYLIRRKVPAQNETQRRCSKRSMHLQCKAGVIQVGTFLHQSPQLGAALKAEITAEVWFFRSKSAVFECQMPVCMTNDHKYIYIYIYANDQCNSFCLSLLLLALKWDYQKEAQCMFCSWHIDGGSTKVNSCFKSRLYRYFFQVWKLLLIFAANAGYCYSLK